MYYEFFEIMMSIKLGTLIVTFALTHIAILDVMDTMIGDAKRVHSRVGDIAKIVRTDQIDLNTFPLDGSRFNYVGLATNVDRMKHPHRLSYG
jgi:hypothetical protein